MEIKRIIIAFVIVLVCLVFGHVECRPRVAQVQTIDNFSNLFESFPSEDYVDLVEIVERPRSRRYAFPVSTHKNTVNETYLLTAECHGSYCHFCLILSRSLGICTD